MSAAVGILAVVVLTAGTGYFVAQEFAYMSADRVELARQAAAGDRRAASAIRVMARLSFMLSAAQVGITVTGIVVGFVAEPAFSQALRPVLSALGLSEAGVSAVSVTTGFVVTIAVQMVLGELFPKNLAIATPEALAKALAGSTLVYLAVSGPVVRLFDNSATWILRTVGIEPAEQLHHGANLEELGHVIDEAEAHGSLPPLLSGVLGRALTFSDRTAGEAMVPRPDVVRTHARDPVDAVLDLVATRGYSHYPVHGAGTDDVVGVVGVRELLHVAQEAASTTAVADIARPALLVPDSLPLPAVVDLMRERNDEFACVMDEYGGLAGIITLEDVAEELVGEITDENDADVPPAVRVDEWWELDAGMRVDEAASHTGLELPGSDDYDTVSGMIIAELGRFAEPGDRLVLPAGVEIAVVSLARHVPELVRLRRVPVPVKGGIPAEAPR
jgi:CBS domain containing-hemolysin-like protein